MQELIKKVEQWAQDKGILEKGNPVKQALKTLEETTELLAAVVDDDREALIDAIGDVVVTLIIQYKMQNGWPDIKLNALSKELTYPLYYARSCVEYAANLVTDVKNDNGQYAYNTTTGIIEYINMICVAEYLSIKDCLQSAYDVISKRNGKMVNGQFVKEA